MFWNITYITRIVLLLLLFQFLSPAFIPVTAQGFDSDIQKSLSLHTEHSSIPVPLVLKEKEETEFEEDTTTLVLTELIDFSDHTKALIEFHKLQCNLMPFKERHGHQLPLFTLFCAFLI